jgi:hypothetical protein
VFPSFYSLGSIAETWGNTWNKWSKLTRLCQHNTPVLECQSIDCLHSTPIKVTFINECYELYRVSLVQ